ncbi:MAG: hypothetical protein MHM6MM_002738 [Cercozoa sp. M6MM]
MGASCEIEAVERRERRSRLALVGACLGQVCDGAAIVSTGLVAPALSCDKNPDASECLSDAQLGLFNGVIFVGMFLGCLVSGAAADRFGRRRTSMAALMGLIAACIASSISSGYIASLLWRALLGFCVSLTGTPLYTFASEWSETAAAAKTRVAIVAAAFVVGAAYPAALACAVVPKVMLPKWKWQFILVCPVPPAVLTVIVLALAYDSPVYLTLFRDEDTEGSINVTASDRSNTSTSSDRSDSRGSSMTDASQPDDTPLLGPDGGAGDSVWQRIGQLVSMPAFYLHTVAWLVCTGVYFGVLNQMPLFFSDSDSARTPFVASLIINAAQLPGAVSAFMLLRARTFRANTLFIVCASLTGGALILTPFAGVEIVTLAFGVAACTCCFNVLCSLTASVVVFPEHLAAITFSGCMALGRLGGFVSLLAFGHLEDNTVLIACGVCSLAMALMAAMCRKSFR